MIMYELFRISGIVIVSLAFVYIIICGLLVFFKHQTLLSKIYPTETDSALAFAIFITYIICGTVSLGLDLSVKTACASAIMTLFALLSIVLIYILNWLADLHNKLPQR